MIRLIKYTAHSIPRLRLVHHNSQLRCLFHPLAFGSVWLPTTPSLHLRRLRLPQPPYIAALLYRTTILHPPLAYGSCPSPRGEADGRRPSAKALAWGGEDDGWRHRRWRRSWCHSSLGNDSEAGGVDHSPRRTKGGVEGEGEATHYHHLLTRTNSKKRSLRSCCWWWRRQR